MTSVGLPPRPPPPPSFYVPHSHIMPLQVPTVPSVVPAPSHLPFQLPISSSSETNVTYLHVPPTHTVLADVHAPFTHQPSDASASACIMSSQSQSITATTQSHSVMHTQSVPHSAVNFNALPTGLTANADTVVPPPTVMPPPMPSTTVLSTPVVTASQSVLQSVPTFIVKQPQMPKPYSGLTSYQSFKEHSNAFVGLMHGLPRKTRSKISLLPLRDQPLRYLRTSMKLARLLTMKFGHC